MNLAHVVIPSLRLQNESNARSAHWGGRNSRALKARSSVVLLLRHRRDVLAKAVAALKESERIVVQIHRMYAPKGRRMDDDGLAIAAKAVRDGVAEVCGLDDRSPLYLWRYRQDKADDYRVAVTIQVLRVEERAHCEVVVDGEVRRVVRVETWEEVAQ